MWNLKLFTVVFLREDKNHDMQQVAAFESRMFEIISDKIPHPILHWQRCGEQFQSQFCNTECMRANKKFWSTKHNLGVLRSPWRQKHFRYNRLDHQVCLHVGYDKSSWRCPLCCWCCQLVVHCTRIYREVQILCHWEFPWNWPSSSRRSNRITHERYNEDAQHMKYWERSSCSESDLHWMHTNNVWEMF